MASGIKSGVSGFVLLIPAIFMRIILNLIIFAQPWYGIVSEIVNLIFVVGILLVSIGAMKLGKYYQNVLPSVAGIIGLIAAIIGLVGAIMGLVWLFVPGLFVIYINLYRVAIILDGIFFILFGVALMILRDKIGLVGLSIGTGVMAIVAGAILCPAILNNIIFLAGVIVLVPTAVCAAYLFLKARGVPEGEVKKVKKLVVRPAEARAKKPMKPEEIEDEVYKYVRKHPGGIDVAECADNLGISEKDVEKVINALVKKGKLEIG